MQRDTFLQRKKAALSKKDKSHIGKWDEKVVSLCNKINGSENYYTTSSCSGRVVLMSEQKKKTGGLFLAVSHELISFNWLKNKLREIIKNKRLTRKLIKFKCEPPIFHLACRNLEDAFVLLEKAKISGFKHSGIHNLKRSIILEINGSDRLEFPVIIKGKILVNDIFLKLVARQANEKLKKGWLSTKKLEGKL